MFNVDIKELAKENTNFRKVICTGPKSQLVLMSIPPGGDIGLETHPNTDQILFFVEGQGNAVLNGEVQPVTKHSVIFVPAGTEHNFTNIGEEDLKLYTVYAPPQHPDGTVQLAKPIEEKE